MIARLEALAHIEPGWLDGEGVPPTRAALGAARTVLRSLVFAGLPEPRIAPNPEGGVEAEWSIGDREISLTFEPNGSLYFNAVDVASGDMSELRIGP